MPPRFVPANILTSGTIRDSVNSLVRLLNPSDLLLLGASSSLLTHSKLILVGKGLSVANSGQSKVARFYLSDSNEAVFVGPDGMRFQVGSSDIFVVDGTTLLIGGHSSTPDIDKDIDIFTKQGVLIVPVTNAPENYFGMYIGASYPALEASGFDQLEVIVNGNLVGKWMPATDPGDIGLDMNQRRVSNIGVGILDTDAVQMSQIASLLSKAGTGVDNRPQIEVSDILSHDERGVPNLKYLKETPLVRRRRYTTVDDSYSVLATDDVVVVVCDNDCDITLPTPGDYLGKEFVVYCASAGITVSVKVGATTIHQLTTAGTSQTFVAVEGTGLLATWIKI